MKGLVPVAMLLIGRRRPREHHKGTSDRILRNFRLRMRAPHPSKGSPTGDVISGQRPQQADIAQLPFAHVRTQGNPLGVTLWVTLDDVTSGQKAH